MADQLAFAGTTGRRGAKLGKARGGVVRGMKPGRLLLLGGVGLGALLGLTWRAASFHGRGQCVVRGAGSGEANGFYLGLSEGGAYAQPRPGQLQGGRVPDVFASWRLLRPGGVQWSPYTLSYDEAEAAWALGQPPSLLLYVAPDFFKGASRQPPAHLWQERRGQSPPPQLSHILPLPSKDPPEWWKRLHEQVRLAYSRPGTSLVMAVNLAVAYRLWAHRVPVDKVSFSLKAVVEDGEYWRVVSASLSHLDVLHLAFNMLSLYNLGGLEELVGGPVPYLSLSLSLLLTTMLANVAAMALLAGPCGRGERARLQQSVGYSCVIFAWVVAASVLSRQYCPLPGLSQLCFSTYTLPGLQLPVNLAPFCLLGLTQLLMPRASFVGHLSGILLGYPLAWGWLDPLTPPLLSAAALLLILAHERLLWPLLTCRRRDAAAAASSPAPAAPPRLPTALLLAVLLSLSLASLSCLTLPSALLRLPLSLLAAHALLLGPAPCLRLVTLVLVLLALPLVGWDLASLGCTLARWALYQQMGLEGALLGRACAVLSLHVVATLLLVGVLLRVMQSSRAGYTALQAVGIELPLHDPTPPSSTGSSSSSSAFLFPLSAPPAFSGQGRTLGGGAGGSSSSSSLPSSSSSMGTALVTEEGGANKRASSSPHRASLPSRGGGGGSGRRSQPPPHYRSSSLSSSSSPSSEVASRSSRHSHNNNNKDVPPPPSITL